LPGICLLRGKLVSSAGRHNRQRLEEREEAIGGLVSAGWGAEGCGAVDRFLFELVVGVLVDVGGLDALVLSQRAIVAMSTR
jgi:hypothetical protein